MSLSKLTRQIFAILLSRDIYLRGHDQELRELVDTVIRNHSIKKSEVTRLQQIEKQYNDLGNDFMVVFGEMVTRGASIGNWRNRLWDAEQEIHDLKEACERENEAADELIQYQDEIIMHLTLEIETLRNLLSQVSCVAILAMAEQIPQEVIEPPTCLKPLDVLKWIDARQVICG